jgi:hypothetical protein
MKQSSRFFEHCIDQFALSQPKIAYVLPYHDASDVKRAKTRLGEENLRKRVDASWYSLHAPSGALQEAQALLATCDTSHAEVLYLIGAGLGYFYLAAKRWLHRNPKRHLVILEDDLSVLYHLFHTNIGTALLEDPQVSLRYSPDLLQDKALSDWLCWELLFQPIHVAALPAYRRKKSALVDALTQKITFDHHRFNDAIGEYMDHGTSYYRNFYPNVLQLSQSYLGDKLFGRFKGVPAIICGAGPSLANDLDQISHLTDRALIFAGGSAVNALNAHGLQPHFGVGVDPNSTQYQRYVLQNSFEVPFFYRQRIYHPAFRLLHGPRLYLSGSGGYDTAALFESALDIDPTDLDEGHNVVNLCTSIAHALGCDPIVYVGLDLAFTGMQLYAPGVVSGAPIDLSGSTGTDGAAVQRTGVKGEPIYTLWKWITESEWIGTFAQEHPETRFFNATLDGLGIPGVDNRDLDTLSQQHMRKHYDLDGTIWTYLQQSQLPDDADTRVKEAWDQLEGSLARCIDLFETMLQELRAVWQEGTDVRTGVMAVTELQLEEEVAYTYVLAIFNEVFVRTLSREMRLLRSSSISVQEKRFKQIELETRRYAFLKETARVNLEQMHQALVE